MAIKAEDVAETRVMPQTLAGATVLQIVPALQDDAAARATLDIARALVHAGARSIVAAERGALVDDLKSFGGEWLPFKSSTLSPISLRRAATRLASFVAEQRIDIVHAKTAGAAWSALRAAGAAHVVTELPDLPRTRLRLAARYLGALAGGDRVIAKSLFHAEPMIKRYRIAPQRVRVIPRSTDISLFDPTIVRPPRVAVLKQAWGIPSGVRVVVVPGRVAPWNGQIHLIEAARMLAGSTRHAVTFVLVGDDRRHSRYVRTIIRSARDAGVDPLFRIVGHVADMPAAYAASDIVVAPCIEPPVYGRVIAEAQAMARQVIASSIGPLPENLLAPPRMPDALRTGWLVQPANPSELAHAIDDALSLDAPAYRALAARARQYGEFMFAPHRVAAATLGVYSSLLGS